MFLAILQIFPSMTFLLLETKRNYVLRKSQNVEQPKKLKLVLFINFYQQLPENRRSI